MEAESRGSPRRRRGMRKKSGVLVEAQEEQGPAKTHQHERKGNGDGPGQAIPDRRGEVVQDHQEAVVDPPGDKIPPGTMPKTDQSKDDQDVADVVVATAHAQVNVIAQPVT